MRLPYVKAAGKTTGVMAAFGGLNTCESAGENEFARMVNLSGRAFPYLATRMGRTREQELSAPGGIAGWADKLIWVDAEALFVDGEKICSVSPGKKQMTVLGACLLVWPDKIEVNLKTGAVRQLENRVRAAEKVTVSQTNLAGEASDTATFIKIESTGIGKGFRAWDGVKITGLSDESLNGAHILYAAGEDELIVPGVLEKGFSQTGGVEIERTCPDMDFITVQANRVWGCSSEKHEIYASKLGDAANWNAFAGTAADSYAMTVGMPGDFTGAAAVNDTVVFFQEEGLIKVLGTKPSNFQAVFTPLNGVARGSENSLAMLDGCLYYLGRDGVYAYDGALPVKISRALDGWKLKNGRAGAAGRIYRLSCEGDGENHMLTYDTDTGLWHREDDTLADGFSTVGGEMFFIADNAIYRLDAGEEIFDWECVTGRMALTLPGHKYISRITVECEVDRGAKAAVSVQYDDTGAWEHEEVTYGNRSMTLNLRERRASFARIRLRGTGGCRIYSVTRGIQAGSELRPWKRT